MIELFINSHRVAVPNDLTFQMLEENPLITQRGVFSFDITLSLLHKTNAVVFGHIQRRTNNNLPTEATAMLVTETKTWIGKIIDIKHTENTVTFQFVAGNSELNYVAKNDNKIWSLDFGTETEDEAEPSGISYATALNTIENPSWENKFVCAPVKIEGETDWANKWELSQALSGYHIQFGNLFNTTTTNNFVIQPYLMYYIDKLPSLLGYTLAENDLENDERACAMYIPNARRTFRYSDFLPDWTVSEFITYVEEFFNVVFVVDNAKNMYILKLDDQISNAPVVELSTVVDKYTREPETNPSPRLVAGNFSYDKTDKTAYFRYNKIPQDILDKCTQSNWAGVSFMINFINVSVKDKFIRNRSLAALEDYIYSDAADMNLLRYIPANGTGVLNYVNKFRDYNTQPDPVSLKIVPATMDYTTIEGELHDGVNYLETVTAPFQLPYVRKSSNIIYSANLLECIEDGEAREQYIDRPSVMEVALYNGMIKLFTKATNWELNDIYYPYPYVDNKPEHGAISNSDLSDFYTWITSVYDDICIQTLRLVGTGGLVSDYYASQLIDTSRVYIYSIIAAAFDVNKVYMIDNQRYIPIKAERTIHSAETNKLITVYFYKLN